MDLRRAAGVAHRPLPGARLPRRNALKATRIGTRPQGVLRDWEFHRPGISCGRFQVTRVQPGTEADDIYFARQIIYESTVFWGYNQNNLGHNTLSAFRAIGTLVIQVLPGMVMVPRWISSNGLARRAKILVCTGVITGTYLSAQVLMPASGPGGAVRLFTSDAAILEAREVRKDVPCTVTPVKAVLGFDLKFHAGFDVSIPLKDLAGSDNQLTTVFRVAPDQKPEDAVYFSQRWNVPMIDADAGGNAVLSGTFDVGEGKYHIDWLMRDRGERVCSFNWDTEASLPTKDKQIALDIPASAVQPADTEPFKQEPAVAAREAQADPLNVKVMINFAPQDSLSATLQPIDTRALISILRNMAREPRITRFSIVAFNMQEQRVIYRQESAAQIDFPALGEALRSLSLGTVDLKRLAQKHGDAEFLTSFITQEIKDGKEGKEQPDAVIIAGPKVTVEGGLPQESFKDVGDLKFPVFYMNYNLNPQANPWRDAIGTAVKTLKGAEFTISRPRDLFFAWTEIIGRIVKLKFGRTATASVAPSR
jgi:hypothetical protein